MYLGINFITAVIYTKCLRILSASTVKLTSLKLKQFVTVEGKHAVLGVLHKSYTKN